MIRILALDLHPASFGYAVVESADLLDWGLRKWLARDPISVKKKLCKLIDWYQPTHLLIRKGAPGRGYRAVQAAENRLLAEVRFVAHNRAEKTAGVWVDGQYVGYTKELNGDKKMLLLPGKHTA